jgi:hypothetical protein
MADLKEQRPYVIELDAAQFRFQVAQRNPLGLFDGLPQAPAALAQAVARPVRDADGRIGNTARADALAYLPGELVVGLVQNAIEVVTVKQTDIHRGRPGNSDLTSMMELNSRNLTKSNCSAAFVRSER